MAGLNSISQKKFEAFGFPPGFWEIIDPLVIFSPLGLFRSQSSCTWQVGETINGKPPYQKGDEFLVSMGTGDSPLTRPPQDFVSLDS